MSFEQQIPERDRNVRLYSNRGEVVVRGERRGGRLADQTGKVSTWLRQALMVTLKVKDQMTNTF